jgi:hypothetical protein
MVVNCGIQTFNASIRLCDSAFRIGRCFCNASTARCKNDRFLSLFVWCNCVGYLLSSFGTLPRDSETGILSGMRHGVSDGWQLDILFRRHSENRSIRCDDRLGSSSSLFRVSESHKDGSCRGFLLLGQSPKVRRWSRNSKDAGVPRKYGVIRCAYGSIQFNSFV